MAAAGNLSDAVGSAGDLSVSDRADGAKIMTNALKILDSRERMVNFRNMPVAAKRVKDTAFFQSTIPLSEWRSSRERLETALDCSIIKIETEEISGQ